jgi:hypothetical protein
MALPMTVIRRIMKEYVKGEVSNKATEYLTDFLEFICVEVAKASNEYLDNLNKSRTYHGLPSRKRLDAEMVENVLSKYFNHLHGLEIFPVDVNSGELGYAFEVSTNSRIGK